MEPDGSAAPRLAVPKGRGCVMTGPQWCLLPRSVLSAASSCVLRTQGFYKKSRFVTHSSDRYQPAEFLNTSQAECEACSHSAPDLKPFLQERKGGKKKNISTATFSMLIENRTLEKPCLHGNCKPMDQCTICKDVLKDFGAAFPLLARQHLSRGAK